VVLDDLVKSKANIKARVQYYMDVLPEEKSLAAQRILGTSESDAPKVLRFQDSKEFKIKGSVSVKETIKEEQKRAQVLIA
jgi:hypothetical protein